MKNLILLKSTITILSLLFFTVVSAQQTIKASDIMRDIKSGKDISYQNKTIIGNLDFTFMDDALPNLPKKRRWWNNNGSNSIKKMIDVSISFINCTFKDNVLAYIPDKNSGYTFTASFTDIVTFKNCVFQEKFMFKYSHFNNNTSFDGSKFKDDTTFKYAKFNKFISFKNTFFIEEATFKYSVFKKFVSFENSIFKDSATFKYTNFKNGVSFRNTQFKEDLNIKYTKVNGKFDITNMKVAYEIDAKYTSINGKKFNNYLISQ